MNPQATVTDLLVTPDAEPVSLEIGPGLTLIHTQRESHATALSLALAGRINPAAGDVAVAGEHTEHGRFRVVALAGAPEIDTLERLVPVRAVIREQLAWAQPLYHRTPKDVAGDPRVQRWSGILQLDRVLSDGLDGPVGKLPVLDRFRLRILLSLIARPEARLLVVDDIDQLRDMTLRDELLSDLSALAERLPVAAMSVNADAAGRADTVVTLRDNTPEEHR